MLRQQKIFGLQEGRSVCIHAGKNTAYNTDLVVLIVMRSGTAENPIRGSDISSLEQCGAAPATT